MRTGTTPARPARKHRLKGLAGFALIAALMGSPLTPVAADTGSLEPADAPGADCVWINEVNNAGGSAGGVYSNRYLELINTCSSDVDMTGWSVQRWNVNNFQAGELTSLDGQTIPAEGDFLIQAQASNQGDTPLPEPDLVSALNWAAGDSSIIIAATEEPLSELSGDLTGSSDVIDALGWGSPPVFHGSSTSGGNQNPEVLQRIGFTGVNSDDFTFGTATPTNSAGEGSEDPDPEDPYEGPETLLVNEIYTQGGEPGAVYSDRYLELYNYGDEPIELEGWSLQWTNPANSFQGRENLSGTVPADGHFLLAFAGGLAGEGEVLLQDHADVVVDDYFFTDNYSFLLTTSTSDVDIPEGGTDTADSEDLVDVVGFGDTYVWAGEAAAPAGDALQPAALLRTSEWDGPSTNNSTDFELAEEFAATNSAGDTLPPGEPQDPEEPGEPISIQEIRGSADLHPTDSPLNGESVTTSGFVTAKYADPDQESRAHDGFYIQQEAACGEADYTDHQVSCAVFVHMGTAWDGAEVEIGDYVEVAGTVGSWTETGAEDSAQLQLNNPLIAIIEDDSEFPEPLPYVYDGYVEIEERERLLGMVVEPVDDWTVTDHYGLLHGEPDGVGGVLGIVDGTEPLWTPTAQHAPGPEADALAAENAERLIKLGHGGRSRWTDWAFENGLALPYLGAEQPVRIGAGLDWSENVILEYRYDGWRFEPTEFLPGYTEREPVSFENTREAAVLPERAGDIRLAGFNVLNYFPHVGEYFEDCDYFTDRHGNPTTASNCTPRGAYTEDHFEIQQSRIVNTIIGMDADVVALQEIENSVHFSENRDYAHQQLVEALNAAEDGDSWDFVPVETYPEDEDVIRNGYVYRPANVELVDSVILFDQGVEHLESEALEGFDLAEIYSNAREPMAAVFQPVDGDEDDQFVTVVNHLKSKGCSGSEGENADQGDGQACFNPDRTEQAAAMVAFTEAIEDHYGLDKFYLMGDFNAHAHEDPMQEIYSHGFINKSLDQASYMFSGEIGALDHVVASEAAAETVAQTQTWNTNAFEPIAIEYSRYEATGTGGLYDEPNWSEQIWRASDHDPIVVDIEVSDGAEEPEPDSWDPSTIYTSGDIVEHDGGVFEALWWTQYQEPGASEVSAWSEIGAPTECQSGVYPAWAASTEFDGGETVVYNDTVFTAKWYSRNQEPGDQWGPWEDVGNC